MNTASPIMLLILADNKKDPVLPDRVLVVPTEN